MAALSNAPQVPVPKRCAVYGRISDDHERWGLGVERQRVDALAYAARKGWVVQEYLGDNHMSASRFARKRRADFDRMLVDVHAGRIDVILVDDISRYTREPRIVEDLIDLVDAGQVALESLSGGEYNLHTPEGRIRLRNEATFAAAYSDFISQRVKRKQRELRESGDGTGGQRAFGWRAHHRSRGKEVKCGMVIDEREAAAIKLAVHDVLAGSSLTAIARRWNEAGFRTPRAGALWCVSCVKASLTNPKHAGYRTACEYTTVVENGKTVTHRTFGRGPKANWPAFITLDDHERIFALLRDPARRHGTFPASLGPFTEALRCACGAMMWRDRTRYRCRTKVASTACGKNTLPVDLTNEHITTSALRELGDPAFWSRLEHKTTTPNKMNDTYERIRRDRVTIERARTADTITLDFALAEFERCTEREHALLHAHDHGVNVGAIETFRDSADVRATWDGLDNNQRRAVLATVYKPIVVDLGGGRRELFDPERIHLVNAF